MWRERLIATHARFELRSGARDGVLTRAEGALGMAFNPELRQLLRVCNGVSVAGDILVPLWPVEEIVLETLARRNDPELRRHFMPMTHLVFIGSEGNGDLYALGVTAEGEMSQVVYRWDHETDGRAWVADSLQRYFEATARGIGTAGDGR